jgi:glycosyltransferase involved in cell wall biosynthesis
MISVCMAVRNGEQFVAQQIDSILPQLAVADELIISDDHSSDQTFQIVKSFHDSRIKLLSNPDKGIVTNFENALAASRGEIIFLADQDDVWASNKIERMQHYLKMYDLVVSDCFIVGHELNLIRESFFDFNHSGKGLVRNLIRNSYMGCCMAFHRKVVQKALPFPKNIPIHDLWIGLIAELYFNVAFIPDKLVHHRRHLQNASATSEKSNYSFSGKLNFRFHVVKNLIRLSYA